MASLVFFGAGASKPFGIPTMQEIGNQFEGVLEKKYPEAYKFYAEIRNILSSSRPSAKIDIKHMMTLIDKIIKNKRLDQKEYFVIYYAAKRFNDSQLTRFSIKYIRLARKIKKELENHIKTVCNSDHISSSDVRYEKSYIPFFKYIKGNKKCFGDYELVNDWKAYTTNYDKVFEIFWNYLERPIDHFQKNRNSYLINLKSKDLKFEHTFCKLHGSLDWKRKPNTGAIIRIDDHDSSIQTTKSSAVLFPAQQEDMYLYPWSFFFIDLKRGLSEKNSWYVVGYSFNDDHIKNAFDNALKNNTSKKLTIIDPNALQIKKKFSKSIQFRIDALPIKFGDKCFNSQFKNYTNNSKTLIGFLFLSI